MKEVKFCIVVIKTICCLSKSYFLFTLLIKIFTLLNSFALLFVNKLVLNEIAKIIINNDPNIIMITEVLLLYGFIELISTLIFNVLQYYLLKFKLQYDDNMSIIIAKSLSDLDMSYYDNPIEYDRTKQLNKNRSVFVDSYNNIMSLFFYGISFLIAFVISIRFSIWITIFSIIMIVPEMIVERNLNMKQYNLEKQITNKQRFKDYLIGMFYNRNVEMEMQLYGYKDIIIDKILKSQKELKSTRLRNGLQKARIKGSMLVLNQIFGIVQQAIMILTIFKRKMTIGDYSYYGGIVRKIVQEVNNITHCINEIHIGYVKYEEFESALSRASKIKNNGTLKLDVAENMTIVFDNVSFRYPNEKKYVLNNVSFSIKQGEKLAFVGVNGSGKSTILKLLLRFYDPTNGKILLNGINIQCYELSSYRKLFSAMFQTSNIYMRRKYNILPSDIYLTCHSRSYIKSEYISDLVIINQNSLSLSKLCYSEENMEYFLLQITRFSPKWIQAQPSFVYYLGQYIQKHDPAIANIFTYIELVGEMLPIELHNSIKRIFPNATVLNMYGMQEFNGIMYEDNGIMKGFDDNVYIEILHDDGTPCSMGEEGNIVITGLKNTVFPLVRYKTGDRGRFDVSGDKIKRYRILHGRSNDSLIINDKKYDGSIMFVVIFEYNKTHEAQIARFQSIYINKHLFFKIFGFDNLPPDETISKDLQSILYQITGITIEISVEKTMNFELNQASNKVKYFICQ